MDDENNYFYNSQNFNPSQGYYPSFDNFPNTDEYQSSFQNISQNSFQDELQTDVNASNTPRGWSEQEDITLMSAWCFVSMNAIVGTNQTSVKLWKNVLNLYEQGRADMPGKGEQRTSESLRQRYKRINANVTKWIGAYKKAHNRATSGQSKEDIEKTTQQLYGKSKFTHHAVFERVMRHNPKWELKLNSTGPTRFQPDEDSLEESRGNSKRSRTSDDGESNDFVYSTDRIASLSSYMKNRAQLRNREAHNALLDDLIEHIWQKFSNRN